MKPFIEIINKYETYISGSRFINYPISRDVFKRYDKIIITTIKFDVSHYKHFIEQYNIKVNKYTYLESWLIMKHGILLPNGKAESPLL